MACVFGSEESECTEQGKFIRGGGFGFRVEIRYRPEGPAGAGPACPDAGRDPAAASRDPDEPRVSRQQTVATVPRVRLREVAAWRRRDAQGADHRGGGVRAGA